MVATTTKSVLELRSITGVPVIPMLGPMLLLPASVFGIGVTPVGGPGNVKEACHKVTQGLESASKA